MDTARTIEDGTPISVLAAARDADLAEAAEQMDRGLRLAMPMLFDGLGPDPAPAPSSTPAEIHPEDANLAGSYLGDAREAIEGAGKALPLDGNIDLHLRFNALVNEIDRTVSIMAERRS